MGKKQEQWKVEWNWPTRPAQVEPIKGEDIPWYFRHDILIEFLIEFGWIFIALVIYLVAHS